MGVTTVGLTAPKLGDSIAKWVQRHTVAEGERAVKTTKGFTGRDVVVITDGRPNRAPQDVRPFGRIEFRRRANMADAVLLALGELRKASPVLTGRYVSTHTVLINGAEVRANIRQALLNVKPTDRVQIVNPQPYARKIEGARASKRTGRGARKASSKQARSGVYRKVHRLLLARFGRTMFIDFTYVKLEGGIKVWGKSGGGSSAKRVQRDQVYPAFKFFIQSGMAGPSSMN
jgi:hypothetical protein